MKDIKIRDANRNDFRKIGLLHTLSWQTTYRNIVPDTFLDNNLQQERETYWSHKLSSLQPGEFVLIAENNAGEIVGFIAVMDEGRNESDAFIDNLHVMPGLKSQGIGSQLLKAASQKFKDARIQTCYLWVLIGNEAAERFYKSRGAKSGDISEVCFGGALVAQRRFAWDSLDALLNLESPPV